MFSVRMVQLLCLDDSCLDPPRSGMDQLPVNAKIINFSIFHHKIDIGIV